MLATGGTVTHDPVALSRLLVLATEDHCVGSLSLHWRQTVMKRFKHLMKRICGMWMMMGLFPLWVSKVICL